ncbi:lipid A biosynthesis acyltransferase [Flavobacteriaceae bacterium Ap0902]|nr:lipid A biosynthesis acyltransferase [Flavobacteriaceae bacterium Ap0902]
MNNLLAKILVLFSRLPLGVLYAIADILFFFQKYFIQYRSHIVTKNLKIAFPEKTDKEIKRIKNKFFRHLCDFPMESVKSLHITQDQLDQRLTFKNLEVLHKIKAENKNLVLLCGHIFNWEWLIGLTSSLPSKKSYAVYYPSNNKAINELTIKSRESFGTQVITMKETARKVMQAPNNGESTFLMVSDQRPHFSKIHYDLDFFNHNAPVFQGYDKLIRKKNMAAVYIHITKTSRGHYTYEFIEIMPNGKAFMPNEVVHKFYYLLEENIKADPSNWLWSHNRWKYKKGKDY